MPRRTVAEQLISVLRHTLSAVMRLALERSAANERIQHYVNVIDSAYQLGLDVGAEAYLAGDDATSAAPSREGWCDFDPAAPKSERDTLTRDHARWTFLEGMYDGWLAAATQQMHDAIEKHLQEAV